MNDELMRKMNNALSVKDLTQADVVHIGDLAAMDLIANIGAAYMGAACL